MKRSTGGGNGDEFRVSLSFNEQGMNEAQRLLEKFGETARGISNGRDYHKFWETEAESIKRVNEAFEKYNENKYDKRRAEELYKAVNAFKAISGKEIDGVFSSGLTNTFRDVEQNLNKIVKDIYSISNFKDAFGTFEFFSKGFDDVEQFRRAMDAMASGNSIKALEEQLISAERTISRLRSEIEELGDSSWKTKYDDAVNERENLIQKMRGELWSKLQANDLVTSEDRDWDRTGSFSKYFEFIENGSMTASEAFAKLRNDMRMFGDEANTIGDDTLSVLIAKIDQLGEKIMNLSPGNAFGSVSGEMKEYADGVNMIESATESVGNTNKMTAESFLATSSIMDGITSALKELINAEEDAANSGERLSKVLSIFETISKISGDNADGISDLSSALYRLNNLNGDKIDTRGLNTLSKFLSGIRESIGTGIPDLLRNLDFSKLKDMEIDESALRSIKTFADGIKQLTGLKSNQISKALDVLNGVDFSKLQGLDIKRASLKNLAEFLPVIASANADNLKKIGEADLTNFNNVKVSKASLEGIANLTEALKILQETRAAVINSGSDGISIDGGGGNGQTTVPSKRSTITTSDGDVSRIDTYVDKLRGVTEVVRQTVQETEEGERELVENSRTVTEDFLAVQERRYKEAEKILRDYYTALTEYEKVKGSKVVKNEDGTYSVNSNLEENEQKNYAELVRRLNATREAYNGILPSIKNTNRFREKENELLVKLNKSKEDFNRRNADTVLGSAKYKDVLNASAAAIEKLSSGENEHSTVAKAAREEIEKATVAYNEEYNAILNGKGNLDDLNRKYIELQRVLKEYRGLIDGTSSSFMTLGEMVKGAASKFGIMISTREIISRVTQTVKKMANEVIALTDAIAEMQIVTGATDGVMKDFSDRAVDTSIKLGVSSSDYLSGATTYARLGYTLEESAKLSEYTTMFQKVANIDAGDAQDAITSIIKAYGKDVDEIEDVLNKLVLVGNNFPISASGIATGMTNMSSAMSAAGNDFEHSVALLTAANTTVQDAARASTGLRTITARLRNTKVDLDELGEEMTEAKYEEVINSLTAAQVSLYDSVTGDYRSTYDVLKDLASVWDTLSKSEQAALATNIAGTRQQDIFYSIINQFKEAEDAYAQMTGDSAHMIEKAFSVYTKTATAHINQFKETFRKAAKNIITPEMINKVVDSGTKVVSWLPTIMRYLPTIATLVAGMKLAANIKKIKDTFDKLKIVNGIKNLVTAIESGETKTKKFGDIAAASFDKAGMASIRLQATIGLVSLAISAAIAAFTYFKQEAEEAKQAAEEARQKTIESAKASVDEAKGILEAYQSYQDARKNLDDTSESKEKLTEVTDELLKKLGIEKEAVDDLSGGYKKLSDKIDEATIKAVHQSALDASSGAEAQKASAASRLIDDFGKTGRSHNIGGSGVDAEYIAVDWLSAGKKEVAQKIIDVITNNIQNWEDYILDNPIDDNILLRMDIPVGAFGKIEGDVDYDKFIEYYNKLVEIRKVLQENMSPEEFAGTDFFQIIDSRIKDYDEIIQNVNSLSNEANNAFANEELLKYIKSNGLPQTTEELKSMEAALKKTLIGIKGFTGGEEGASAAIRAVLPEYSALASLYNELAAEEQNAAKIDAIVKAELGEKPEINADEWLKEEERIRNRLKDLSADEVDYFYNLVTAGKDVADDLLPVGSKIQGILESMFLKSENGDLFNYYQEQIKEFREKVANWKGDNKPDLFTTIFGNIDLDDRQVLEWTEENLAKFSKAIESWQFDGENLADELYGSISTVFGSSDKYYYSEGFGDFEGISGNIDIAFSPMLQTEDGPVLLDKHTADEYIYALFDEISASGEGFSIDKLLKLDAKGLKFDVDLGGFKKEALLIKGLIADIGATAQQTSEIMHYLGKDGSIFGAHKDLAEWIDTGDSSEELEKITGLFMDLQRYTDEEVSIAYRILAQSNSMTLDEMIDKIREVHEQHSISVYSGVQEVASRISMLKDIYNDVKDGGNFDWSKIINNDSFKKAFGECKNSYNSFIKTVTENSADVEKCKSAFDDLVTELILTSGAFDHVSEAEIKATAKMLEEAGVVDAEAKLTELLRDKSEALFLMKVKLLGESDKLTLANYAEAAALMSTAETTDVTHASLAQYLLTKMQANKITINTVGDINNLIALANAAGASTAAIGRLMYAKLSYERANAELAKSLTDGVVDMRSLARADQIFKDLNSEISSGKFNWGFSYNVNDFVSKVSNLDSGGFKFDTSGLDSNKNSGSTTKDKESEIDDWFTPLYKQWNHQVKMEEKTLKEYIDWLEVTYPKAVKDKILTDEDALKYEEEVFNGRREIFEDYINDLKHQIDIRDDFDGELHTIIGLIDEAITAIENRMKELYAAGYTMDDAYMQKLQKNLISLMNDRKKRLEDAEKAAKDAVDKLVDYIVKMRKQEIQDQRDAIKKQLDALKDFYAKQKELLQDARDEEKYLDEQAEKRKEISRIEQELAILDLDNSAWATKRKIELRQELAEKQKELSEFEKDHALEVAQDQLDSIEELQEKALEKRDEQLEKQQNDEATLRAAALEELKNGNAELYTNLINWNQTYGDGINETITTAWENAYKALSDYKTLYEEMYNNIDLENATNYVPGDSFGDMAASGNPNGKSATDFEVGRSISRGGNSYVLGDIDGDGKVTSADARLALRASVGYIDKEAVQIAAGDVDGDGKVTSADARLIMRKSVGYASGTSNATRGLHMIDEEGAETIFQSKNGSKYKMFSGGEKVLNAKASDFLYNFATKGAELIGKIFGAPNISMMPAYAGAGNVSIEQGDIIIQGNVADKATLSAIRRAQRESTSNLLKEFSKLQK